MIDQVLAAAYPDARPATLQSLYGWIDYDDRPRRVVREGKRKLVQRDLEIPWREDGTTIALDRAYIWSIRRQRLVVTRSWLPIVEMLTIIAVAVAAGWFFATDPLQPSEGPDLEYLTVVGAIALAVVNYLRRWLVVVVDMTLSMTDADQTTQSLRKRAEIYSQPAPATLTSDDTRVHDAAALTEFAVAAGLTGNYDNEPGRFQMEFITRYRAAEKIGRLVRDKQRAREGLALVESGIEHLNGPSRALSYNQRDVATVVLDRESIWTGRIIPILVFPVLAVAPLYALVAIQFLADLSDSAILTTLIGIAGIAAMLGIGLWVLTLVYHAAGWLAGTDLRSQSGNTLTDPMRYRVRIRAIGGRRTTLLMTPHSAVAVEVYNLVARDIRKPVE